MMKILTIIITTGLLLLSTATFAHTGIKSTSPKNNAVLTQSPKALTLTFKGDSRLMKVGLLDTNQEDVKLEFKPSAKAAETFRVPLPELSVGKYKANWIMMGKDGHKMKGHFAFTIDSLSANHKEEVPTAVNPVTKAIAVASESMAIKKMPLPLVTVYKSATCGCCAAWVDHMKDSGFTVETHDTDNLDQYKVKAKLGAGFGSCHTAFVGDYAIEGHVPADVVKRLLAEKPAISGLTAPGMPMNSPGMAPKGSKPLGYDVLSFKDGSAVGVFSKY